MFFQLTSIAAVCVAHVSHMALHWFSITSNLNTTPYYQGCDVVQINQTFGRDVEEPPPPQMSLVSHSCQGCPPARILFACIIGGNHTLPPNTLRPWETVTWRPSPPLLGDRRALGGKISRGGGGAPQSVAGAT